MCKPTRVILFVRRYDPVHYMAPEGGYATDPDGAERTLEFRQMVQARAMAHESLGSRTRGCERCQGGRAMSMV